MSATDQERIPNDKDEEENVLLEESSVSIESKAVDEEQGFELAKEVRLDFMLLFLAKAIRMFSFGFFSVMLVEHLLLIGFSMREVGVLFTWTLLGDTIVSLLLTSRADRLGRRYCLLAAALLALVTSLIFSTQTNFTVLLISGILGVISPSGGEIGPFIGIELSSISQIIKAKDRTMVMAWYNLWGSCSSAFGALVCGAYLSHLRRYGYSPLESCRIMLYIVSFLQGCLLCIVFPISPAIEAPVSATSQNSQGNPISAFLGLHKSKNIVIGLSLLFMIDSFAGSFAMQSVISGWFSDVYGTSPATLGSIVFVCNILAGVSALFAARLASIIGLVMTMVVTHLPSNVLIILVPIMPNELLAIIVLCARFSISQMDVPTRNAYVQSVVDPDERSGAAGVTNVVRSLGASAGPWLAGMLYANKHYRNYPFFIAGGLKIIYDLLLLWSFKGVVGDEFSRT